MFKQVASFLDKLHQIASSSICEPIKAPGNPILFSCWFRFEMNRTQGCCVRFEIKARVAEDNVIADSWWKSCNGDLVNESKVNWFV